MFEALDAFLGQRPERVEIVVREDLGVQIGAADPDELHLRPFDNSCKAEPADGRGEQRGIALRA